ncbi:MAG: DNA-binding protein, partial [Thermodesulfobacteriota bacterium]|nr:DNA-binding protein [Thermodesulfobacteriota bacterium]
MTLENLIGRGVEVEPADAEEITRLLDKIKVKIADAKVVEISLDTRFDIAYEALLQIGLTALRCHNLRPNSRGGHHVTALQTLPLTIGYPKQRVRLLEEFRKQRAAGLYDGSFTP